MTEITKYPHAFAAVIASKLAQQLEDGTLEELATTVCHEEDTDIYTLTITYQRVRGSAC